MDAKKCSICGGDLIRDYATWTCRCGHCGSSRPLSDSEPECREFSHIAEKLAKADSIINTANIEIKQAEEAVLLYKSAAAACTSRDHADIAAELRQFCKDRAEKAETLKNYIRAKSYFEKKAYAKALKGFEPLKNYRDSEALAQSCRTELAAAQKRRIPYAIIIGMILPAILFFFLKEKTDISIPLCALIFFSASACLAYAVYLNGIMSVIVEVTSFIMLVPLLIFTVLIYIFHIKAGPAAAIAIGVPLIFAVGAVLLSERQ